VTALTVVLLLAGFAALVGGGEVLVRGASGLARSFGLSPLVIGLTVVSFATSAPEFAVTLGATLSGSPGIAVGNVVGSNVANVLLVLGLAALVLPVAVRTSLVRADVPVVIGLSLLLLLLSLDGEVSRLDGVLLVVLLLAYIGFSVVVGRRQGAGDGAREQAPPRPLRDGLLVLAGVALLVIGARWLVSAATEIAEAAGISDLVIGLTVVAIGTSLPELAACVVGALRKESELSVGNVLGSNLFNVLFVIGCVAVISPISVDASATAVHFPIMLAFGAVVAAGWFRLRIGRSIGAVLLSGFLGYMAYLVLPLV
jgi:cation:H+ antiporter